MALSTNLADNASGTTAKVDTNGDLITTSPQVNSRLGGTAGTPNFVGASRMFCEKDSGSLTGTPYLASPQVSEDDLLQVGLSTPIFDYVFNATAQDTSMWYYAFSTMTITESGGSILFNANSTNTTTTGCYIQSKRYFNLTGNAGAHVEFIGSITSAPIANEVFISGLGIPVSATAPPTDGVWFQLTSAGLIGVLAYNGTITQTGTFPIGGSALTVTPNTNGDFKIIVDDRVVEFWMNGLFIGEILTPTGNSTPFMSDSLPLFQQYYNSGTVTGTAMQVKVGAIHIDQLDSNLGKPYSHIQAAKGLMAYQGVNGGTMGSTATFPNATAATTVTGAALSQTVALAAGLGGQAGITAAVPGIDGFITSYLNPVGGVNQSGRTIYITGVKISSVNIGAAVATTPSTLSWSLAFGGTAANLALAESTTFATATAKAFRRVPLGIQSWIVGAVVGATVPDLVITFQSPIAVNPGEYIASVAKFIQGTATASQVIFTNVTFDAYME